MAYLIAILITILLLVSFLALTRHEAKRGTRFFARLRTRLDERVEHVQSVLAHANVNVFLREETHRLARRIAHDCAHFSLQAVRATERFLTRLVLRFRPRQTADTTPRKSTRAFVKTLSDFKGGLKTVRHDALDIQ